MIHLQAVFSTIQQTYVTRLLFTLLNLHILISDQLFSYKRYALGLIPICKVEECIRDVIGTVETLIKIIDFLIHPPMVGGQAKSTMEGIVKNLNVCKMKQTKGEALIEAGGNMPSLMTVLDSAGLVKIVKGITKAFEMSSGFITDTR